MIYSVTIDFNHPPPHFLEGRLSYFFPLYWLPNRWALLSLTPFKENRKLCLLGAPSKQWIRHFIKEPFLDITTFLTSLKQVLVATSKFLQSSLILRNFLTFGFIQVKAFRLILEQTLVWIQSTQQPRASCGIERRDVYGNIPLPCFESNNHRKYINQIFNFLS